MSSRDRSLSVTTRERAISDLEAVGAIDMEQKGLLKELAPGDYKLQNAIDYAKQSKQYDDLKALLIARTGNKPRKDSLGFLESMNFDFYNLGGSGSRSNSRSNSIDLFFHSRGNSFDFTTTVKSRSGSFDTDLSVGAFDDGSATDPFGSKFSNFNSFNPPHTGGDFVFQQFNMSDNGDLSDSLFGRSRGNSLDNNQNMKQLENLLNQPSNMPGSEFDIFFYGNNSYNNSSVNINGGYDSFLYADDTSKVVKTNTSKAKGRKIKKGEIEPSDTAMLVPGANSVAAGQMGIISDNMMMIPGQIPAIGMSGIAGGGIVSGGSATGSLQMSQYDIMNPYGTGSMTGTFYNSHVEPDHRSGMNLPNNIQGMFLRRQQGLTIHSHSDNPDVRGFIGHYSPADRKKRIARFLEKRNRRVWTKKVKYDVRKNFADSRLRIKGRFVKKEEESIMRQVPPPIAQLQSVTPAS